MKINELRAKILRKSREYLALYEQLSREIKLAVESGMLKIDTNS